MIAMDTGDISSAMVVGFLCLAMAIVPGTNGYSSGAPQQACETLTPGHINSIGGIISKQEGLSPYVLTVDQRMYGPNTTITVTVDTIADFKGILLQARSGDTPVGTWVPKDGYRLMSCTSTGDSLTHSSSGIKTPGAQFQWIAPTSTMATVTFMATIARTKDIFWTPHTAVILTDATAGPFCTSRPCVYGLCYTGQDSYYCGCNTGYTGTNCESRIVQQCDNGLACHEGTCYKSSSSGSYFCFCNEGFYGTNCYLRTTACAPTNPCKNSGECSVSDSNDQIHACECTSGYEGPNCEQQVTPMPPLLCDSNPCLNGGNCVNNGNAYSCTCSPGYEGINCDTMVTPMPTMPTLPCNSNPCLNGGNCANNGTAYSCTCSQGYEGINCGTMVTPMPTMPIIPCDSNPCLNGGNCVNNGNAYSCTCSPGYEGINCDTMVTGPCSSGPCDNGGYCRDEGNNAFTCVCLNGFAGNVCQRMVSCSTTPEYLCENLGTCTSDGECQCRSGFIGIRCQNTTDACIEGTTCENGGSCSAAMDKICSCVSGYTGDNCEIKVTNHCVTSVCKNDGNCINKVDMYICACKDGYTGQTCATLAGRTTPPPSGLPLEIWWIVLICLIGLLLLIIVIAVCYTICRSDQSETRHMVGNKRV